MTEVLFTLMIYTVASIIGLTGIILAVVLLILTLKATNQE